MENLENTPDDILHNILSRLPAKPLLRFTCVSKHWNRLISEPCFMKSRSRRMLLLSTSDLRLHFLDNNLPKTDDMAHAIAKLCSPFGRQTGKHVTVLGTLNGIVLLGFFTHFQHDLRILPTGNMILYNPFTRASKKVPYPHYPFNNVASTSYAFGFGYGATRDDLKIVIIEAAESYHDCGTFHVFDINKGGWSAPRDFDPMCKFSDDGSVGMFLNGFLYWQICGEGILALNIEDMVFTEIDLPHECKYMANDKLGSLNGCLCMLSSNDFSKFSVWVMKEQGVASSWSIACSFDLDRPEVDSWNVSLPIYIMGQGRILMENRGQLYIYDTSKHSRTPLICVSDKEYVHLHAMEYVETLVSPSDICVAPKQFGL